MFQLLHFLCFLFGVYGLNLEQHRYTLIQDDVILKYVNYENIQITAHVYKFNDTDNVMNLTFTLKTALPENSEFSIRALKWINDDYRAGIIQIDKRFKDAIEMEMFDLQSLWVKNARPPIVWPLEKGVTYSTTWNPDSTKFPPSLPGGRYKVRVTVTLGDNESLVIGNWFIKIVYKKRN